MPKPLFTLLFIHLFCLLGLASEAANAQPLEDGERAAVAAWLAIDEVDRPSSDDLELPESLSIVQSRAMLDALWSVYRETAKDEELGALPPTMQELAAEATDGRVRIQARAMTLGDLKMPFAVVRREKAEVPAGERPLFICMHGGGANPKASGPHAWNVNSREWNTQTQFAVMHYPADGVYFVPRMADDRLGRWWHAHNHDAFERVIKHGIAHWGIDPNRVYLLGISEGGFGTDILGPFMPDRFAGANAMASGVDLSNPPQNLRNLPFRTDVGEKDTTFNRVGLAQAFHERLDTLGEADPAGYTHSINVQAGRGHGIDYRPGVEWIIKHQRNPWPDKLVWLGKSLHDRRRDRHFWVQVVGELEADAVQITAEADRENNTLQITAHRLQIDGDQGNPTHANEGTVKTTSPLSGVKLRLLLHDDLINLDRPVTVTVNGDKAFEGLLPRDAAVQLRTLAGYGDPAMAASAEIELDL